MEVVSPPLPAAMCLGFPFVPLPTYPDVSTATLPLSQKTDVQGQAKAVAQSL